MINKILLVLILTIGVPLARGTAIFTVGAPIDAETVDSLIQVDVTVFGLSSPLESYGFDLGFNPAVLQPVGAPGTIDGSMIRNINQDNVGLNYGGSLMHLYFYTIGPGTSWLAASNVVLCDADKNQILATVRDGSIIVDSPSLFSYSSTVPEPNTALMIACGLVLVFWRAFRVRKS